jgi:peptidyl-prolyl cis-trans isomerase SDCCAG10
MRGHSSTLPDTILSPATNGSCSPPKIKTIRIIENPFDDIVPRITAAEKRAQQLAKEASQRQREENIRKKGAKKCVYIVYPFAEL